MAHLDQSLGSGWERDRPSILVIGAGGAARAVVAGLLDRPIRRLLIANRTEAKASDLLQDLGFGSDPRAGAWPWEDVDAAAAEADLIVNTTSLGMTGQAPLPVDLARARATTIVADIVYVPLRTPFLAAAEARGLATIDGLGMLLHQAVPGFARWFGVTPEITPALRAMVIDDIEGRP
jgi:shikimate dehydrogenase